MPSLPCNAMPCHALPWAKECAHTQLYFYGGVVVYLLLLLTGLLSTEAGNVGRVVGDVAITVLGVMTTDPTLLVNYLFLPLAAGIVMCMVITFIYFDKFAV